MVPHSPFKHDHLIDLPEGLSHFEVLSLSPHWRIDPDTLKKKFLELSALVHPDRYDALGPPESLYALRWSTAVNRAYQTLRDPEECTRYFLKVNGVDTDKIQGGTPTDLAEEYFEAQDGPQPQLISFRNRLEDQLKTCEATSQSLAKQWPSPNDRRILSELKDNFVRSRYIRSMLTDLNKHLEVTP